MSSNLGNIRIRRRGLYLPFVALLAGAALTGCRNETATGPKASTPVMYQGTFSGGTGENGVITITVPTATSPSLVSYSGLRANVSLASASSLANVTGTLTFARGGTTSLAGTFDPSTGAFSMAGGGYTFTGALSNANVSGTYAGPNGSGSWAALPTGAGTVGAVVSGTYTGTVQGANTDGSGAFSGPVDLQLVQTGAAVTGTWSTSAGNTPSSGTISGTINGSAFTFTMIVTASCAQGSITGSGTTTNGGANISASFSIGAAGCSPKGSSGTFQVSRGTPGTVVAGTYRGTLTLTYSNNPPFTVPETLVLTQSGISVQGAWSTQDPLSGNVVATGRFTGTINGAALSFMVTGDGSCDGTSAGSATIANAGGTLSGSSSGSDCQGSLSATFLTNRTVSVAAVIVTPATETIAPGGTAQLTATTGDGAGNVLTGRAVTWASGNTAVATVNASGLVNGVAAGGPVTITATSEGKSGTAAITVPPASPGTWTPKASMQTATSWPAATAGVINGILYVVGGASVTGTGTALTALQAYDPVSNAWTTKASMPTGREGPAAGAINGLLYLAGGVGSGGVGRAAAIDVVEAYDPATDTWTTKAHMPTARSGAAAGVMNGILYVVGGANTSGTSLTAVEAYNPATNSWATKAPRPTPGFGTGAVINGILYVAGSDAAPAAFEAYDPATDTWTTKASMLTGHAGAAAGVINGILYVAGGFDLTGLTSVRVEGYNPATDSWVMMAPMTTARGVPAGGVANGVLYVAGGQTTTSNMTALVTVDAFTP